ncbi:hypothetical protein ACH0BF_00245 [Pseudobacillus sp. 179-B 2D1 NHS]|uniref:hypothetical protein n=1 Tax=Pseudobacillus sp. 179-B 2D1 NHS TaxID=3374292 RepID=UPI00387A411D
MSSSHNDKKQHESLKGLKQRGYCKTCGSYNSTCKCQFKVLEPQMKPLTSDCTIIDSIICSKEVQKVAELTVPLSLFGIFQSTPVPVGTRFSLSVNPNVAEITHNVVAIKDKVVNIGTIPANLGLTANTDASIPIPNVTFPIPFQEHTDCPGACPGDLVQESPFVIEGVFVQSGAPVPFIAGDVLDNVAISLDTSGFLIKIILRTTITVIRPIIVDKNGNICDVNPNRCNNETPPTFNFD